MGVPEDGIAGSGRPWGAEARGIGGPGGGGRAGSGRPWGRGRGECKVRGGRGRAGSRRAWGDGRAGSGRPWAKSRPRARTARGPRPLLRDPSCLPRPRCFIGPSVG